MNLPGLLAAVMLVLDGGSLTQPYDIEGEHEGPDVGLVETLPHELRKFDVQAARVRFEALDRALDRTREPIARANLVLERATLHAAHGMHESLLSLTALLRQDEIEDPAQKQAVAPEITAHKQASTRANARAIADFTELVCDPQDREKAFACRAPAALHGWPAMDEALYRLAFILNHERREDDARHVLRRIVDHHPTSRHHTDALLGVADVAFRRIEFAEAEPLYQRVLTGPGPAMSRAYAASMLGWVQLNLGRDAKAFTSFTTAAALAGHEPRAKYILRAARQDLVRAYAGFGTVADAFAAFERSAPGHGLELLVRLGETWFDQGKATEAIAVFVDLRQRAPDDPRACEWQDAIARGVDLLADLARQVAEIEQLQAALARARSQPSVEHLARCTELTRKHTLELAYAFHLDFMRTRDRATADRVERLYAAFVTSFPTDAETPRVRYARAEAAWLRAEIERSDAKQWSLAASRYDEAIAGGLDPKLRADAEFSRDLARKYAATRGR